MSNFPVANMVIRGRVIEDDLVEFGGRGGELTFRGPDPRKYAASFPLESPSKLSDLHGLKFTEILDYLDALAKNLDISRNAHMQEARELTYRTAPITKTIVDAFYDNVSVLLSREVVRDIAEQGLGLDYVEGWVKRDRRQVDGTQITVRAFGTRGVHIVAGNGPTCSAISLLRSAITRSDCVIKTPSNDPFTAIAIGKTMVEMAPDHPITRHYAVAHWRGGDEEVESQLYRPQHFDKVIAWGGFASIKHISKYLQPGLELISFDPKSSISVIGGDVLSDPSKMKEAAIRLAADIATMNQHGCSNSRIAYVLCGTDEDSLSKLKRFGAAVYEEMLGMPPNLSTTPKTYDLDLRSHVNALRLQDEWYEVIGGKDDEGAIIVSLLPQAVEFAQMLDSRTANIVPVNNIMDIVKGVDTYTQTVGVYPESLKTELLNILPLYGAQRFCSLGAAIKGTFATPHDGMEPVRRMCKWVYDEIDAPDHYTHSGFGVTNNQNGFR